MKILSGHLNSNSGAIDLEPGKRISFLEQDHNSHDKYTVMETVIRGNISLFKIKQEMEEIYSKENFSDDDGERLGELQNKFEKLIKEIEDGKSDEKSEFSKEEEAMISEELKKLGYM